MSKIFVRLAISILAALVISEAFGQSAASEAAPKLQSFEFIGCSGDSDGKLSKPEVWRVTADKQVSFLTHHVDSCGLEGRRPTLSFNNGTLNLGYELYSPSGMAVMCDCEYWAKFTFGAEASGVKAVTVGGQQSELRGDWPGR